jgi:phage gp29-like protein
MKNPAANNTSSAAARNIKRALDATNRWRDSNNPLRNLTMPRAVQLMEMAQRGVMAELQWVYAAETGIEATDPDLMAIIERTVSGVSDCEWQIETAAEDTVGFDQALADDQAAFLRESFGQCDNLDDAVEHLVTARFRGFAHLSPWLKPDWTIEHLEPLPQWNMVRDGTRPAWAFNPRGDSADYAAAARNGGRALAPEDYILLDNRRPVNRIALIKYIRATISEKDWDSFVEIYGLPAVFIIMPERVPDGKEEEYAEKAESAAEAASGALPHGSDVKTLSEVRGAQPFQTRLEWLQKQLVLAGTGGLLTMLAESGSGTLAGGAHQSAWDQIVRRVTRLVCRPVNRQYVIRALAARFPGRPALASFALRANQEKDVGDTVANVTALVNAGFDLDPEQVQKETGYTVTGFSRPAAPAAFPAPAAFRAAFRRASSSSGGVDALMQSGADALAQAQAADNRPLALAIARVLTAPGYAAMQAACKRLRGELPGFAEAMLADPAQADTYHRIMSSAFLQGVIGEPPK